ncbi:hypothetical protein FIV02_24020 [Pseudomonas sp. THAF187a]|uniref:hypothetical protein n=1 Tax=unclassified Pseudomonas TaxID=196821 RepID=UPI00126816B5|nr:MULTISPECIES: hypothetical protein [unclassified Pseudomonas]QFT24635.1 hypothetical protein FIV02_24020 [Pseudomonas sp. THAF187a]QFT44822.1 hypothetical protein FIU98_24000 [Pseudomonas sp. THAF42]
MPNPDSFYSPEAYHPKCVPDQPPAEKQPWLRRFGSMRLPWGSSQDIVPPSVLTSVKPASLRLQEERDRIRDEQKSRGEYKPKPFEHIDLHDLLDHERIRHAQFPASSKFWMYMQMLGKGFSCITIPLILFSFLITEDYSHPNWPSELANTLLTLSAFIFAPLLAMWGVGSLVVYHFPKLWIKPSRGPLWEFNRRTGLVTVFDYDNQGEYKKNGTIGEKAAPFYEFDAYITVTPDRQGLPNNVLCIVHRYQDIWINMGNFVGACSGTEVPCALWDYLQNYMDISKPLPDTPRLEAFRHLDPTTAEHDHQTSREPRYWRDMDDETFEAKERELDRRISQIDTFNRPNLMALHVSYAD